MQSVTVLMTSETLEQIQYKLVEVCFNVEASWKLLAKTFEVPLAFASY